MTARGVPPAPPAWSCPKMQKNAKKNKENSCQKRKKMQNIFYENFTFFLKKFRGRGASVALHPEPPPPTSNGIRSDTGKKFLGQSPPPLTGSGIRSGTGKKKVGMPPSEVAPEVTQKKNWDPLPPSEVALEVTPKKKFLEPPPDKWDIWWQKSELQVN